MYKPIYALAVNSGRRRDDNEGYQALGCSIYCLNRSTTSWWNSYWEETGDVSRLFSSLFHIVKEKGRDRGAPCTNRLVLWKLEGRRNTSSFCITKLFIACYRLYANISYINLSRIHASLLQEYRLLHCMFPSINSRVLHSLTQRNLIHSHVRVYQIRLSTQVRTSNFNVIFFWWYELTTITIIYEDLSWYFYQCRVHTGGYIECCQRSRVHTKLKA